MNIGFTELLLIVVMVFVIFGAGKLPKVMGDVGRGLRAFRAGMKLDDNSASPADHTPEPGR